MTFLGEFFSRHSKKHLNHTSGIRQNARTVGSIMTPRVDIIHADDTLKHQDVLDLLLSNKYQAIPVCHKTLDAVKGVVDFYTLNALSQAQQKRWQRYIKKPFFVPEAMYTLEAAQLLDETDAPFLLVVDEYGGVNGLITRRHLLRSLTHDHTSSQPCNLEKISQNMLIDGRMSLENFARRLPTMRPLVEPFMDLNIETMGGLACHLAGRLPRPGEHVIDETSQLSFRIVKVNKNTVESMTLAYPNTP